MNDELEEIFDDLLGDFLASPRQRRIQQKRNHIAAQQKIAEIYGGKEKQPHRFHKTKAMNCGDPNCVMCGNPRKFWGERTIQERRFYENDQYDGCDTHEEATSP